MDAATAQSVADRICGLLVGRLPEYADWPAPHSALAPLLRVTPEIISLVDYTKGFGHSDLLTVAKSDRQAQGISTERLAPRQMNEVDPHL